MGSGVVSTWRGRYRVYSRVMCAAGWGERGPQYERRRYIAKRERSHESHHQPQEHGLIPTAWSQGRHAADALPRRAQQTRAQTQTVTAQTSDPSRVSFTGSIAAGLHETLNLLWRPLDPDHPEDVFLRRSRHAARTNAQDEERRDGRQYDAYVDDDMPIRAVYGPSMDWAAGTGGALRATEDTTFAPLGTGSRRF